MLPKQCQHFKQGLMGRWSKSALCGHKFQDRNRTIGLRSWWHKAVQVKWFEVKLFPYKAVRSPNLGSIQFCFTGVQTTDQTLDVLDAPPTHTHCKTQLCRTSLNLGGRLTRWPLKLPFSYEPRAGAESCPLTSFISTLADILA